MGTARDRWDQHDSVGQKCPHQQMCWEDVEVCTAAVLWCHWVCRDMVGGRQKEGQSPAPGIQNNTKWALSSCMQLCRKEAGCLARQQVW